MKMLKNKEIANDIFQEVFVKFYLAVKKNEFVCTNLIGYLFTIARNLIYTNNKLHRDFVPLESVMSELKCEMDDTGEFTDIINKAIDLLDAKYKEIYVLKEQFDMSYSEISEICDLTYDGVKSRYRRAKIQLLDYIKPYIKDLYEK